MPSIIIVPNDRSRSRALSSSSAVCFSVLVYVRSAVPSQRSWSEPQYDCTNFRSYAEFIFSTSAMSFRCHPRGFLLRKKTLHGLWSGRYANVCARGSSWLTDTKLSPLSFARAFAWNLTLIRDRCVPRIDRPAIIRSDDSRLNHEEGTLKYFPWHLLSTVQWLHQDAALFQ